MLRLELVLHLCMVPFLKEIREPWRSGAARAGHTLTLTPFNNTYLEHGLWEVPVEEPHYIFHVLAAFGPYSDHIAIPKPGGTQVWLRALCGLTTHPPPAPLLGSPVLEVLDAAQAAQPPIHHDGQSCTQSLTLLHAVDRQHRLAPEGLPEAHGGVGEGHTCVMSAPPNVLS